MKRKNIKRNVSRVASLLLVVAALAVLLTVGALADGTQRSVTLSIKNFSKNEDGKLEADLSLSGDDLTAENGVIGFHLYLDVPEGLTLEEIDATGSDIEDSMATNVTDKALLSFTATNIGEGSMDAWKGGYIAKLLFSVDPNATGQKVVGFTSESVVYYGTGVDNYTFVLNSDCEQVDLSTAGSETKTGLLGDVNGDGSVDVNDATLALQYYVGAVDSSKLDLKLGNVNGDGSVDVNDATAILQYYVTGSSKYPIGKPVE